jgi:SAM-dependent MidA family methyltransferase
MERAGRALQRGFVLSVDYGHEAQELFNERHMRGTLLAYSRHRAGEDFFTKPGEQDLTAHVNFSALEIAGRRAGLERCGLVSQSAFLLAWGKQNEFADLYDEEQSEIERLRARLLLKTLIFPEGMGETFFVHVMQKGVSGATLTCLQEI